MWESGREWRKEGTTASARQSICPLFYTNKTVCLFPLFCTATHFSPTKFGHALSFWKQQTSSATMKFLMTMVIATAAEALQFWLSRLALEEKEEVSRWRGRIVGISSSGSSSKLLNSTNDFIRVVCSSLFLSSLFWPLLPFCRLFVFVTFICCRSVGVGNPFLATVVVLSNSSPLHFKDFRSRRAHTHKHTGNLSFSFSVWLSEAFHFTSFRFAWSQCAEFTSAVVSLFS